MLIRQIVYVKLQQVLLVIRELVDQCMLLHEPHPVLVFEAVNGGELQLCVGPMWTKLDLISYTRDCAIERAMAHEL